MRNRFSKVIKLKAFLPFKSAEEALEAINDISEGEHGRLFNFYSIFTESVT